MKQLNRAGNKEDRPPNEKEALLRLAKSGEAQALVELLQRQGNVQTAAKAAAAGDASQLMEMMNQLMATKEGAKLVDTIQSQVKKAGIK